MTNRTYGPEFSYEEVTTTEEQLRTLSAAARALLDKLSEMEKPIDAVCVISSLRGQPYTGPTWTAERDALAAIIAEGEK